MAFLKRVLSSDYRRALAAEAAGEYVEAARAYALAGERGKVAEMHLLAAERTQGRDARIGELKAAARWMGEGEIDAEVARRIGRALLLTVKVGGVVTEGDRALLREAAALLARAGDGAFAGEALELAGDEQGAADAYQAAGEVERLERVLARDEERRGVERRLREASEEHLRLMAAGARTEALERLRECARLAPSGPSRQLAEELAARRLARGVVPLREEAGKAAALYAGEGAFPVGLGREPSCEIALRDARVSRRHAEIVEHDGRFFVRDCRSRNGTRLGGVVIEGELPLEGEGEIGLGDAVTLDYRVTGSALRLEVARGADRGLVATIVTRPIALAGGAVTLRFSGGVPIVEPAAGRPTTSLRLNGAAPGPAIELAHGDVIEVLDGAAAAARLEVE